MRVKLVLTRQTLDLIWALGAADPKTEIKLAPGEAIVDLDGDVVLKAIDLFGEASLDECIRQLAYLKINERRDAQS